MIDGLQYINFLLLPGLVLSGVLVFHSVVAKRPGECLRFRRRFTPVRRRQAALLAVAFLVPGLAYEAYFQRGQCAVSQRYSADSFRLLAHTAAALQSAGIDVWPAHGTLYSVANGVSPLPWQHNAHLSIVLDGPADRGRVLLALQSVPGARAVPDENGRDLFHIVPSGYDVAFAPHTNVWSWRWTADPPSSRRLHLHDPTAVFPKTVHEQDVFPLQHRTWAGLNMTLPRSPERLLVGDGVRDHYLHTRFSRKDCFHNFLSGRWAW